MFRVLTIYQQVKVFSKTILKLLERGIRNLDQRPQERVLTILQLFKVMNRTILKLIEIGIRNPDQSPQEPQC